MKLLEVVITSVIVSVVCNKVLAAYTFKVIDGYVREVIELAKSSMREGRK